MVTEGFGHAQKKEIVILHSEYPDRRTDSLSSKGSMSYRRRKCENQLMTLFFNAYLY